MWRLLAAVTRNLQNIKKSSRVADESMFDAAGNPVPFGHDRGRRRWSSGGLSFICSILHAPVSILSCVSSPHVNNYGGGSDHGVWVSGEFAQISEMNQLMVSDSMRYAILM